MSKIKLLSKIKSVDENSTHELCGIMNDNRIVYNDSGIKTTLIFDDKLYMSRETDDYKFEFIFLDSKSSKGKYTLKLYNNSIDVDINTSSLVLLPNVIKLKYELLIDGENCGLFDFELKYEKVE